MTYLPVPGIEAQRGDDVIQAGDFILGKVNMHTMWDRSMETMQRLQALNEKLRELVFLAWKLERHEAATSP